jgi:hypothetical protein
MSRILFALCVVCACLNVVDGQLVAQTITVGKPTVVSPAGGGWHPWYEIHVSPDDANNMIICGTKWLATNNAPFGFVYHSSDRGSSWTQVLEDKSSEWVTEQSCAFGVHGVAYFVSNASKMISTGSLKHELGTTRIYTSRDSGKTWTVGVQTGWTDSSTSVVDTKPGPNQNRLYVFFNGLFAFYNSLGAKELAQENDPRKANSGTRVGIVSYKDGDSAVAGPYSSIAMLAEQNHGSYPAPAFLLDDGSLFAFYVTQHKNSEGLLDRMTVEGVRIASEHSDVGSPVTILDPLRETDEGYSQDCGYSQNIDGAYDAVRDKLYFVFPAAHDEKCRLFLVTSSDGGRSWSKPQQLLSRDETDSSRYRSLAIAVNRDGILAVMWEQKPSSGCWMFAIAESGSASLSRAQELGTCGAASSTSRHPSSVGSSIIQEGSSASISKQYPGTATIYLRDTQNLVWRDESIAVTPDGEFRPIWIDSANGNGEIRTTIVRVTSAETLINTAAKGLKDVTSQVILSLGADQPYDFKTNTISFKLRVTNNSIESMKGPFKVAVSRIDPRFNFAQIANATNGAPAAGAVWDIDASIPSNVLGPGATSEPFLLKFQYVPDDDVGRISGDVLGFSVRVFAKVPESGQ